MNIIPVPSTHICQEVSLWPREAVSHVLVRGEAISHLTNLPEIGTPRSKEIALNVTPGVQEFSSEIQDTELSSQCNMSVMATHHCVADTWGESRNPLLGCFGNNSTSK